MKFFGTQIYYIDLQRLVLFFIIEWTSFISRINFDQNPFIRPSGYAQSGRREVPGSFLGHACRPTHSEFSVVFSETRVNTD